MADAEVYKKNLASLERIMACLNAQEEIIGRGAIAILYQAGKDVGKADGQALDRTADVPAAIDLIKAAGMDVYNVEVWKDAGRPADVVEEDGFLKLQVVFRECPVRQVCVSQGVKQDGAMCRLAYGYYAGLLTAVTDKKIDLTPIEVGPNACKKEVRWRPEA